MDYDTLKNYIGHAWSTMTTDWADKLLIGSLAAAFQIHAELVAAFTLLIFMDLFTKWIALAKPLTANEEIWEEIRMIPEAHRQGIINSYTMRTRFVSKILLYLIVVIGSSITDIMFRGIGAPAPWLQICVGYLAAVELKSVLENLNDAGVTALDGLIEKIKRRG